MNSVSADIRIYTINFFYHLLLQELLDKEQELIQQCKTAENTFYHTDHRLKEGLIILPEGLLLNSVLHEDLGGLPWLSKLRGMERRQGNNAKTVTADPGGGILTRHISLGFHGRYKGTFLAMELLDSYGNWQNQEVWAQGKELLLKQKPWRGHFPTPHDISCF